MSFIRPEARAFLARWAETIAVLGVTLAVIWSGARTGLGGSIAGWAAALLALVIGGWAARAAFYRARLGGDGDQRVFAQEGRIVALGPYGRQQAEIDALVRVEIAHGDAGPAWMLTDESGLMTVAPFAADPDRQVLDALSALPGFSHDRALSALTAGRGMAVVWRRPAQVVEILPPG